MKWPVFLPQTTFPMKGRLAAQDTQWLAVWQHLGLYRRHRQKSQDRPLFVLHDGPPYANGPIHLGHGLNKILKDMAARSYRAMGYDVSFVPGWDCHGLPIETQIEKDYAKQGKKRHDSSVIEFRQSCRDFAQHWVEHQKQDFQRLGVMADWDGAYTTMTYGFESRILHHFYRLVNQGYIYRGLRPVLWSPVEQTALAESEVEYQTMVSTSLYVRFPVAKSLKNWGPCAVLIWTTTPWSLPGNRGVAYAQDAVYGCYEVLEIAQGSLAVVGEKLIVAPLLWDQVSTSIGVTQARCIDIVQGHELAGLMASHPLQAQGYDAEVPLVASEFVTMDAGTGLVHTAPGHGVEDFTVGQRYGLEIASPLNERGIFVPNTPLVEGLSMKDSIPVIIDALTVSGTLMASAPYTHSYPHSWRSKTPLFYRATSQWFIALDGPLNLRQKALNHIGQVTWWPGGAENRMRAMLSNRPDWCISRQRVWGVPIAMFVHRHTNDMLQDERVFERITQRISREGSDFWFTQAAYEVLDGLYDAADWIKNDDIIDVWFESGVTHAVVLQDQQGLSVSPQNQDRIQWPASLYLEGSDQHRAWFQSSLTIATALQDQAPYQQVVTHGFVLDQQGRKMSKSLGNVFSPQQIVEEHGADILRLWVAYENYHNDVRIGPSILERVKDIYRRLRNTLRFTLGALHGLSEDEYVDVEIMPPLERWIHHRLFQLDKEIRQHYLEFDYASIVQKLHSFCNEDLSSFYVHICKDSLYCDATDSMSRRHIRTTLYHCLVYIAHWLAPIIPFTAEEVWSTVAQDVLKIDPSQDWPQSALWILNTHPLQTLNWDKHEPWSIHLNDMPQVPAGWQSKDHDHMIQRMRHVRSMLTQALERAREQGRIGDNLQTAPHILLGPSWRNIPVEFLASWCVVSDVTIHWSEISFTPETGVPLEAPSREWHVADHDLGIDVIKAPGVKCSRCWKCFVSDEMLPSLGAEQSSKGMNLKIDDEGNAPLCHRCREVMQIPTTMG